MYWSDEMTGNGRSFNISGLRPLIPVLAGLAGIVFSLTVSHMVARQEQLNIQSQFNQAAKDRVQAASHAMSANVLVLESIHSLYLVSDEVSREEFRNFVQPFLNKVPGIQALEWIPRVSHTERAAYEQAARQDGLEDFHITVRRQQGRMHPAPVSKEYFPVYYVEPLERNEAAVGFDLASNQTRKAALDHSRDEAAVVGTARITLVQEKQRQYGFLIFLPVYAPDRVPETLAKRRETLRGFALGVFRIGDIIENAIVGLQEKNVTIAIYDLDATEGERFLYACNAYEEKQDAVRDGRSAPLAFKGIEPWRDQVIVGGRRWSLVCMPTAEFLSRRRRVSWGVFIGGSILSVLLGAYLAGLVRQSKRPERVVAERTAALSNSERRLRTLIETIPDLVWLKDVDGVYLACNPKFERFFGAKEKDIIGKTDYDFVDKNLADFFRMNDKKALAAGQPVINEEEIVYADDGHRECLETVKTCLLDSKGAVIGVLGIARDITERKKSATALQQAHDSLEEKVQKRTVELQRSRVQLRSLYAKLQAAQESERKQISREIHDELGTVLTGFKYDLSWVQRKITNPSAVITEKINTMSKTVDSIIGTVQKICAQLRPGLLDDMGLAAAIEWQANKFAKMGEFVCKTDLDENIDLEQDCSTVLFRIFQELLTNILRHAKADKVQISLKQQGSKVVLAVEDNGIGIGKEQILDSRSLGLIGMRERVIIYGGSFEIKGSPGEGTIATVIIPIEKKGSDNDKDIDM